MGINIQIFATDQSGERIEIDDLYWFEEQGVHDFAGSSPYGTYTFSNKYREQVDKSLGHFGLDPESRTRITGVAGSMAKPIDPVEAFKRRKESMKLINGKKGEE